MGAGASTLGVGGPTAEVGRFRLNPQQQQYMTMISNLFQLLLKENNIMDLSQLVSSQQDACSDLIITLSARLDKEFQRLQLPTGTAEMTQVGFISDKLYRDIQKSDVRVNVCKRIAEFLLQFVILISALTASIVITDRDPSIEREEIVMVPMESATDELKGSLGMLDPNILARLQSTGVLQEVRGSRGDIYKFLYGNYYLHISGLLYTVSDKGSTSPVYDIRIEPVDAAYFGVQTSSAAGPASANTGSRASAAFYNPDLERERITRNVQRELLKTQFEKEQELQRKTLEAQSQKTEIERKQEQIDIERLRRQADGVLLAADRERKDINYFFGEIDFLLGLPTIDALRQSIANLSSPPTTPGERQDMFNANALYRSVVSKKNAFETAIETLRAEQAKTYGVTRDAMRSKLDSVANADTVEIKRKSQEVLNALQNIVRKYTTVISEANRTKYAEYVNARQANMGSVAMGSSSSSGRPNPFSTVGGAALEFLKVTIVTRSDVPTAAPAATYTSSESAYAPQGNRMRNSMRNSNRNRGYPSAMGAPALTQPQYGGADTVFIMDFAGNTYDDEFFRRSVGRVSPAQRSQFLSARLDALFKRDAASTKAYSIVNRFQTSYAKLKEEYAAFGSADSYSFRTAASGIVEPLLNYFKIELDKSSSSIQSPAAQRAYHLVSDIKEGKVITRICKDPWADVALNNIPAYALFGALFKNLANPSQSDIPQPVKDASANEFRSVLETKSLTTEDTSDVQWRKKFARDGSYSQLTNLCDNGVEAKLAQAKLREGYRKLQQLYNQHLMAVLGILGKLFVITPAFKSVLVLPTGGQTNEPILQLHPGFVQENAAAYLERVTKEAIVLLDKHYAAVEATYADAVSFLVEFQKTGVAPTAPAKTGGRHNTRRTRGAAATKARYSSFRKKRVARR